MKLSTLEDTAYNIICPLNMLLVHGLRVSRTAAETWGDLKRRAEQHPEWRVEWSEPREPVFYAIQEDEAGLDIGKPADPAFLLHSLQVAAKAAGITEHLTPRDGDNRPTLDHMLSRLYSAKVLSRILNE